MTKEIIAGAGKLPPSDIPTEKAILGAILSEKPAFSVARTFISAGAFFSSAHEAIFLACERLFSKNIPIDLLTVSNAMRAEKSGNSNSLENAGGAHYLTDLCRSCSSMANMEFHCRIVTEMWMRRLLIKVSNTNTMMSYDLTHDVFDVLAKSQGELSKITDKLTNSKPESVASLAFKVLSELENEDGDHFFVPMGIPAMDNRVKLCGGDLVILAARPGMGKTSLIVNMIKNLGLAGRRGLFFSLEVPSKQIVQKILSADSGVPYWKIRERKCDDYERERLAQSYGSIRHMSSAINDSSNLTIEEIKAISIAENAKSPIEYIIIDFLQITKPSTIGTRDQEIGHITRNAKMLAKILNVPVIYLSQLSRDVEKRGGDKRPVLSDLRDSGNIEQDADTVIFMYRAEYYGISVDEAGESTKGICEVDYAKNRHGGTGSVKINCQMDIGKFW